MTIIKSRIAIYCESLKSLLSKIEKKSRQTKIKKISKRHITPKSSQWAVTTSSTSISTMKKTWKKLSLCSKNWSIKFSNQIESQTSTSRFTWLINFDSLTSLSSWSKNARLRSEKRYYTQINVKQWLWKSKTTNVDWRMFYTFLIWELICCSKDASRKKICKKVSITTTCTCTSHKTQKCSKHLFEMTFI